jgi:hypothetical protein
MSSVDQFTLNVNKCICTGNAYKLKILQTVFQKLKHHVFRLSELIHGTSHTNIDHFTPNVIFWTWWFISSLSSSYYYLILYSNKDLFANVIFSWNKDLTGRWFSLCVNDACRHYISAAEFYLYIYMYEYIKYKQLIRSFKNELYIYCFNIYLWRNVYCLKLIKGEILKQ